MRVSHHVKRSVCLLHSLLLLAQGKLDEAKGQSI